MRLLSKLPATITITIKTEAGVLQGACSRSEANGEGGFGILTAYPDF